jgi:hypothetical protein
MLAIVSYPTLQESEAHIDLLTESEKAELAPRKRFLAEFERKKLRSTAELPDLSTSPIVLAWDFAIDQHGKNLTVIK